MTRTRTLFYCTECGNDTPRWQGQCPSCNGWNTLVEQKVVTASRGSPRQRNRPANGDRPQVVRLANVEATSSERWSSGMQELDFVLGGGVVPGSVVLVAGEPGIGKSTLLLQIAARLVQSGRSVLYSTGEESVAQVWMRAERLDEDTATVDVLAHTELNEILRSAHELSPDVLLVDSVQTVFGSDFEGVPGSVNQVRECAAGLHRYAKEQGTAILTVGHVTKAGGIAGPKTLEHIVDTVLYFENAGGADHRILRATKNRFGSVDEIAVFRMTSSGLVPVTNPSELFLGEWEGARSGCAVTALMEGSRPLLVEIQSLTARASYGSPQRVAAGFDHKRLAVLLAVLEKRVGVPFGQLDVFLNVVGGLRIVETGGDAAVAVALVSSARDIAIPAGTVVIGELGLGGEMRSVPRLERRLAEASRMGFTDAFVPKRAGIHAGESSIRLHPVDDIASLLESILG